MLFELRWFVPADTSKSARLQFRHKIEISATERQSDVITSTAWQEIPWVVEENTKKDTMAIIPRPVVDVIGTDRLISYVFEHEAWLAAKINARRTNVPFNDPEPKISDYMSDKNGTFPTRQAIRN